MRIFHRKAWGARKAKCGDPNPIGRESTLFVHWSAGSGLPIDTKGERAAAMRAIQNLHMDDRGWCDVAYSYVLFQPRGFFRRPRLFEGRTFKVIPASQEGANTGNGSVCVVMGPGDPLKRGTVRKLRGIARRFPGRHVKGHRDVGSTECPGDKLYSHVGELDKLARRSKKPLLP